MSELLETEVAVPFMAEVLSEVFTGGPEICLKVREDQVERMFQILAQGKGDGQTEIIMTLQAIAKVSIVTGEGGGGEEGREEGGGGRRGDVSIVTSARVL